MKKCGLVPRPQFFTPLNSTLAQIEDTMNVKVEIELNSTPNKKDKEEMYSVAEYLTNDAESINIYQLERKEHIKTLVAGFTIDKARQIDVVDRIGNEFSYNVANYSQSSISFSKKLSKKRVIKTKKYTPKQGQYLSFIYYFTKIIGSPPAEANFQKYFKTSPPAVHNMIRKLADKGFIQRKPRAPRSIKLLLERSEIPDLE